MAPHLPEHADPPRPEPALRFRHIPLLFIALSAAVTQPYATSFGELALAAGVTILSLTPPVLQLLRHYRRPSSAAARPPAAPATEWLWAFLLVALANLIYLINLVVLRGSLLAR